MTDIVVDYTLELFWVLDLHPRSQERTPKKGRVRNKKERKKFEKNQEPFLTLEDVPDSWDGDQEPKIVPMCSQQPYLSFTKGLGLIP